MAAMLLWLLDASLNISMEPFRAFVGDMLRQGSAHRGYAMQTAFIGAGAVFGSIFPWLLDKWGVPNTLVGGGIPDTVRYSFWFGGAALLLAMLWTILTTREYSPEELARFRETTEHPQADEQLQALSSRSQLPSVGWMAAGTLILVAVAELHFEKEVYLLGGLLIAYGLARLIAIGLARSGNRTNILAHIVGDFSGMPPLMKRLAVAQFFTWSALYTMWVFTTPSSLNIFTPRPIRRVLPTRTQAMKWATVRNLQRRCGHCRAHPSPLACANDRQSEGAYDVPRLRRRWLCKLPSFARRPLADAFGSWHRHCLGVGPGDALCDSRKQPAPAQARHIHGPVQRLHRRPPTPRRNGRWARS